MTHSIRPRRDQAIAKKRGKPFTKFSGKFLQG